MTIYNKYTQVQEPPSNYDQYGEGDFLLQLWGGTDKTPQTISNSDPWYISKDGGNTWYLLYPSKGWFKGEEEMSVDANANDNDKTLDYSSTLVFLSSIYFKYQCTATSGYREITVSWINQDDSTVTWQYVAQPAANQNLGICFSRGSSWSASTPLTVSTSIPNYSAPLPVPEPFHGSVRFHDAADIDDNDDMSLQVFGWYAQPKFKEYAIKNCKNLCIGRTSNQTMYDDNGQMINVLPLLTSDMHGVSDPKVWVNK